MNRKLQKITRFFLFLIAGVFIGTAGCSGDDDNPATANPSGGAGGTGGSGGSGAQGGASGTGGNAPVWQKGVVGRATKGAIVLAQNAGQIQGFAVKPGMVTYTMSGDGGLEDADPDALTDALADASEDAVTDADDEAGAPNTVPTVDFGGITPDFTEMWFPIPPYKDMNGQPTIGPLTGIVKPDGTVETRTHFADWTAEFTLDCYQPFDTVVNGTPLKSYGGLSLDMADCLDRHFFITNASNKVYELFEDGTREVLTADLPEPGVPSAILCHPEGYLVVTTLPGYVKNAPMSKPTEAAKLVKVTIDSVPAVSLIATLPITETYATSPGQLTSCWSFTHTALAPASGIRIPIAVRNDASFLVGDVGARIVYAVSKDGASVNEFSDMPLLTASAIFAPNDVMYMIDAPLLNKAADTVLQGTMIRAYDGTNWTDILELTGYDPYIKTMSWGMYGADCPPQFASEGACRMPYGVFTKISYGASPILYIIDPIKGQLIAVPLDMGGDQDAGTDDAAAEASDDAASDTEPDTEAPDAGVDASTD